MTCLRIQWIDQAFLIIHGSILKYFDNKVYYFLKFYETQSPNPQDGGDGDQVFNY